MVRLTDSNEEEVHANIRRAYEDAKKNGGRGTGRKGNNKTY